MWSTQMRVCCMQTARVHCNQRNRLLCSLVTSKEHLQSIYEHNMNAIQFWPPTKSAGRRDVFANTELQLSTIQGYGFDYDYTLAVYTLELHKLIYDLSMHRLITEFNYPSDIRKVPYDPKFAIRGLHFDVANGLLLKLDQYLTVEKGTVFRGKRKLPVEEVSKIYPRFHVHQNVVEQRETGKPIFRHLPDLFSLPEIGLISSCIEYFDAANIQFDPVALMEDVNYCVNETHASGQMYKHVIADLPKFLHKNPGLEEVLQRLKDANKTLFLITNSPFKFLNPGMTYMLGENWRDLFNVIVVQARKPDFFKQSQRPFRVFDTESKQVLYAPVHSMNKDTIYVGGNVSSFTQMASFENEHVLYFGDHIGADLTDVMLNVGWNTACVVPELSSEIVIQNSEEFRNAMARLLTVTQLLQVYQEDARKYGVLNDWVSEREHLAYTCKAMLNPQFGSIFRTSTAATYFSRRLTRLSDIYMSRLPNLLQYSLQHTFYPRRQPLAHEMDMPLHAIQQPGS